MEEVDRSKLSLVQYLDTFFIPNQWIDHTGDVNSGEGWRNSDLAHCLFVKHGVNVHIEGRFYLFKVNHRFSIFSLHQNACLSF